MKLVGIIGSTRMYLAESIDEAGDTIHLRKAITFNPEGTSAEIARHYVKGTITGKVADVELTRQSVVSRQDAEEIGPLVELMMHYLPLAEKQARANALLPELDAMMKATAPKGGLTWSAENASVIYCGRPRRASRSRSGSSSITAKCGWLTRGSTPRKHARRSSKPSRRSTA